MSDIENDLLPSEEIVYRAKISGGYVGLIIFFIIISYIGYIIPPNNQTLEIIKFGVYSLAALYIIIGLMFRARNEFVVTSKRIIKKTGMLGADIDELFLKKIERIEVTQGIIGKILGEGAVLVKGAGWKHENPLVIKNPQKFKRKAVEAIDSILSE